MFFRKNKSKAQSTVGWKDPDSVQFRFNVENREFVLCKSDFGNASTTRYTTPQAFEVGVEDASLLDSVGGRSENETLSTWLSKGIPWPDGRRIYFTLDALIRHGLLATQGPAVGRLLGLDMPNMQNLVLCGSPHYYFSTTEKWLINCQNCKGERTHFFHYHLKGDMVIKFAYCDHCGEGWIGWYSFGVSEMPDFMRAQFGGGTPPTRPFAVIGKLAKASKEGDWIFVHQRGTPNFYAIGPKSFTGQLSYHNGAFFFVNTFARESIGCEPGSIIPHSTYYPIPSDQVESLEEAVQESVKELLNQPEFVPWSHYFGGLSFHWDTTAPPQQMVQRYWGTALKLVPAGKYVDQKRLENHMAVWLSVRWF